MGIDGVNISNSTCDTSRIKAGAKLEEMQEEDKAIFQKYDANNDGVLDETEMETLLEAEKLANGAKQEESYKHNVEYGDTWYGIVQAKYGITDHAQTMEICRQLKKENGVSTSATNMPKEVTLPSTVTLKNGTEIELKDRDAKVDNRHNNETNYNHPYNVQKRAEAAAAEQKRIEEVAQMKEQAARDSACSIQTDGLESAEKAFRQQLDEDGWAGKTADTVSVIWGSENRAVKVEADIKKYKTELAGLNEVKSDKEAFAAKFKEIYGIDYNPANISAYEANPTDENYEKAYGTKNNIAKRVAVYNKSQQDGAAAVKTTVVVAASAAAAVATGGASLAATAAVAGVSAAGARIATEVSDLATNNIEGDLNGEALGNIAEQALVEGIVTAATAGILKGAGSIVARGAAGTGTKTATTALVRAESGIVKAERGLVKAGPTTGTNAGAKAGARAGANTSTKAGTGAAAEAGANATEQGVKNMVNNIASKVAEKGGINKLSTTERAYLEKVFGVKPENVSKLSKTEMKEIAKKLHTDKIQYLGNEELFELNTKLFQIFTQLL